MRLISLLLACVTTTNATSLTPSLTAAKVDADVRVPNASFTKKVNTAVLHVHTPGPSFLLFGFPKCGTTTLWDSITRHPKIKGKGGVNRRGWIEKELHSLDNGHSPRGEGQVNYDGWEPEESFARKLPSSLAADEVSGDGTPWYSVYLWPSRGRSVFQKKRNLFVTENASKSDEYAE